MGIGIDGESRFENGGGKCNSIWLVALLKHNKNINFDLVYSNLLLRSNRLFKQTKQKLLTKKIQGRPKFKGVPEI